MLQRGNPHRGWFVLEVGIAGTSLWLMDEYKVFENGLKNANWLLLHVHCVIPAVNLNNC